MSRGRPNYNLSFTLGGEVCAGKSLIGGFDGGDMIASCLGVIGVVRGFFMEDGAVTGRTCHEHRKYP